MDDKELIKEALREWLDEKFTEFGKWTVRSLAAMAFGAFIYFAITHGLIKG